MNIFKLILKIISVLFIIAFVVLIYIYREKVTNLLLQDIKAETESKDQKYILTTLAEDYEELLRQRRELLLKEKDKLLSEQGIARTLQEKRDIERRLKALEIDRNNINNNLEQAIKDKAEKEKLLQSQLTITGLEMTQLNEQLLELNEKYQDLSIQNEKHNEYWKQYISDMRDFFNNQYKDNTKKLTEIDRGFEKDNGKQLIMDEVLALNRKVFEQNSNILELRVQNSDQKTETKDLKQKIEELSKLLSRYNNYVEVIEKFEKIEDYYSAAQRLYNQKRYTKAATEYEKILKEIDLINNSYTKLNELKYQSDNEKAEILYKKAMSNINRKLYDFALTNLSTMIRETPNSKYTGQAVTSILRVTNIMSSLQLVAKDNENARILFSRAEAYNNNQNYREALDLYYQIISDYPFSDYVKSSLEESKKINKMIEENRLKTYGTELKDLFKVNYLVYKDLSKNGQLEKARNYYFKSLDKVLGDYTNNTIKEFKRFEDKYIELLLENYEEELMVTN